MPKTNLPFGKIVATPTLSGWSQAYSAGGLFVTLALNRQEPSETDEMLGSIGKKLINDLEAEFFALEEKSLTSIKQAILNALSDPSKSTHVCAAIAYAKDTLLYLFLYGGGKILLRRGGKIGVLLQENKDAPSTIQTASGHVEHGDLVIMQSPQFETIISEQKLAATIENQSVEDIAETLSPLIHESSEGCASALFFSFLPDAEEEAITEEYEEQATDDQEENPEAQPSFISPTHVPSVEQRGEATPSVKKAYGGVLRSVFSRLSHLSHRQRVLLSVAVMLVVTLFASIGFTAKNEQNQKTKSLFAKVYEPAKRSYEEGQGLLSLNTSLAREELLKAKKLIDDASPQIPKDSKEGKELAALQKQVDQALEETSGAKNTAVSIAKDAASPLLSAKKAAKDREYVVQDEKLVYFATAKEIGSVAKSGGDATSLVKNDGDWEQLGGLGTFLGNLYVLDRKGGIVKYVAGSSGYGKSAYFSSAKPDLTNAVSMGIDGSVYVLFTTGDILKFTRGAADSFQVSGLEMPFKKPTRLLTSSDMGSIYVLDKENSRIVKLTKSGAYQAQYAADIIQKTSDIDVSETDKKVYLLAENTIYEMPLE